jgi:Flp pilus assembly protein TadG
MTTRSKSSARRATWSKWWGVRRAARVREAGYVAVLVSILVPTLFLGLAATAVDTARWYLEMERVQEAADAAALAGVPFLPQDLPSARTRALEVAKRNGYDDAAAGVKVTVTKAERESQLKVTISARITNQFGQLFGVESAVITRHAVADFTGPAPMGSPCNVFGTEPPSGSKGSYSSGGGASPQGSSAIGSSRPANCKQDPEMWATVEGPQTGKVQGDRYGTVYCEDSDVQYCDSSKRNTEYTDATKRGQQGYYWLVKVLPSMVNRPISLQLYDPAFVRTGQFCQLMPSASDLSNNMNAYVRTDGKQRYGRPGTVTAPAVTFCTGDDFAGSASGSQNKMTTTFVLRQQHDSQDPLKAPVQNDSSGRPCAKQYGSFTSVPRTSDLDDTDELTEVFHNWHELCTFTPNREGDYYLHVRTNKHQSFSGSDLYRDVPSSQVAGLLTEAGDNNPQGGGSNGFAVRAVTPSGLERGVAVSGWDRMPIYANSDAATTTFNLIRILPGAAGQSIEFDFFDAGDAAGTATIEVMLPSDARTPTGRTITNKFPRGGCTSVGGSAGTSGQTSTSCKFTLTRSGGVSRNNGKVQSITIPIPSDYSCDATNYLNCWYQVKIDFASGDVHDVTTWDAQITGDPVRLIE